jgi:hypothetical protein
MGKRVIHDTEMTIDEETGIITVKFPGWREDPSKMFSFFPGEGSGQGFPLSGNTINISDSFIMSVDTGTNPGINVADDLFNIALNGVVPNGDVDISMSPNADGTGKSSFAIFTKGNLIAKWQDDNGEKKYGVFDKAPSPNVQPTAVDEPVGGAVIDVEARQAIVGMIVGMKQLGHMEDPV